MKRFLHPFVVMPVVAVIAVAVWWFGVRDDGADTTTAQTTTMPTAQLVDVTSGSMNDTVSAEGTVAAAETEDLSFTSSGTVTAVNVQAGDTVTAGQVLATIDSTELAAAVTSAESNLADAQAKLADDQDADASDEQIAADLAQIATATDALDDAETELAGASLVAGFDGTVTTVDLTVGEELGSGGTGGTTLTGSGTGSGQSPSTGSSSSASGGPQSSSGTSTSTSSTAQIQVVSSGRFEVEVTVDSTDIDSVTEGLPVDVTVSTSSSSSSGFPGGFGGGFSGGFGPPGASTQQGTTERADSATASDDADADAGASRSGPGAQSDAATATGTVTSVSRVADASSGVAGYTVTISFEGDPGEFFVGTTVTADIVVAERTDVIQVPSRAITTDDSGSTVLVSTDGEAGGDTEQRTVTTGLTANGMTEITSGLDAGEQVEISFPGRPGGTS